MSTNIISRGYSSAKKIKGGRVLVKWTGFNIEQVKEHLTKALESLENSKKDEFISEDEWDEWND